MTGNESTESRMRLNRLFLAKQAEMLAVLQGARETFDHTVTKGSATEQSWRSLLQSYLPTRYQVDSGIVMDSLGSVSQQIDVVIFDRQYSPVLFETGGEKYIPAESVYSVFEVKQELSKENVRYSAGKIASVRRLHRTSIQITYAGGAYDPRPPLRILGGMLTTESSWNPAFGSPLSQMLNGLDNQEQIDLVCALGDGSFVAEYQPDGEPDIRYSTADISLVSFLFNLLSRLQQLGTVPAMDYSKYLASFE